MIFQSKHPFIRDFPASRPLITQGYIPLNPYHIPTMVDIYPQYISSFSHHVLIFVGYPTTIHHETVTIVIFPINHSSIRFYHLR